MTTPGINNASMPATQGLRKRKPNRTAPQKPLPSPKRAQVKETTTVTAEKISRAIPEKDTFFLSDFDLITPAKVKGDQPSLAADNARLQDEKKEVRRQYSQLQTATNTLAKDTAELLEVLGKDDSISRGISSKAQKVAKALEKLRSQTLNKKQAVEKDAAENAPFVDKQSAETAQNLAALATEVEKSLADYVKQQPNISQLSGLKEDFQLRAGWLDNLIGSLSKSIASKIDTLNTQINQMKERKVNQNDLQSISHYTGQTVEQIQANVESRQGLMLRRETRQDDLQLNWGQIQVRKASADWAIRQVRIECGLLEEVRNLSQKFDKLLDDVNNAKGELKSQKTSEDFKPEAQGEKLGKLTQFAATYKSLNDQAAKLKTEYESLDKELAEAISNGNPTQMAEKLLSGTKFYDKSRQESLQKEALERFEKLLGDKIAFKRKLEETWNLFSEKVTDTVPMKIERYGDAATNKGVLPYETAFNVSWPWRKLQYVNKAFTQISE